MLTNIITAAVTAYIWTGHRCADNHWPKEGVSVAVPRAIPLGSTIIINGHAYLAQDHTSLKYDGRFDIYLGHSYKKAMEWGNQTLIVTIYEKEPKDK